MKAIQGLILTFLIMCNVKAQDCTTHKFVDADNILKYSTTYFIGAVGSAKVTFSKDSFLLNERYYKKLIVLDYEVYQLIEDYYFREENGKVYIFQNGMEILLYDFCLNLGDYFNSNWKVIVKKTISTDGGATTRNQFVLQHNSGQIQIWIEGIGGVPLVLSNLNLILCEYYTKDHSQIYYEILGNCASPVKTIHVSDKNIWHLTVPQWVSAGYDYWLSFSKDSFLLDKRYYRKLMRNENNNSAEWKETNYYYREHLGRIFRKYKDDKEELSYNYAAAVGDTLYTTDSWTNGSFIVSDIENIIMQDGTTRRKLTVKRRCSSNEKSLTWIEGVGETRSQDGIELGCIVYDPETQFNCLLTNNKIVYSNGFCISSTEPTDFQTNITLQPNPTTNNINIIGDVQNIKSIQISDVSGRLILLKEIQYDLSINVSSLASGVYICRIQSINGKIQTMKFVKL